MADVIALTVNSKYLNDLSTKQLIQSVFSVEFVSTRASKGDHMFVRFQEFFRTMPFLYIVVAKLTTNSCQENKAC
jgi:hypothetical protein